MRTVYDEYNVRKFDRPTFFAGANTASGFIGEYGSIADEKMMERVYIIKGGPGTGKSTFMKKCAAAAEKSGYSTEQYLCGSDPDSLDCVVIAGRIAVLDGTAPHIRDMTYPIVSSEIIDVSGFLNSNILEKHRKEVIESSSKKSEYYKSAYEYLSAAQTINNDIRVLSEKVFLREKARRYIHRLIKKFGKPTEKRGMIKYVRTHGITMKGLYSADFFGEVRRYTVADYYGCAALFMELVCDELSDLGFSLTVSKLPVPDEIVSVYIEDYKILISSAGHDDKCSKINLMRFVNDEKCAEIRGEYRLASKLQISCIDEAVCRLKKASEEHFKLENIYVNAMDFKSLEQNTDAVIKDILSRLNRG